MNDRSSNTLMKGGTVASKRETDPHGQSFQIPTIPKREIDPHGQSFQIPTVLKKDPTPIGLTKSMLDTGRKEGFIVSQKNIDNIDNPDIPDKPSIVSRIMNPLGQTKLDRARLRDKGLLMTLTDQISGQGQESSQASGQTSGQAEGPTTVSNKPVS